MLASDKQHILSLLRSPAGRNALEELLAGASPDSAHPEIGEASTQPECASQFEQADVGIIDWKMEAERANRLLAQAEAQVEAWREQAGQKDAEFTVLRDQVARQT